MFMSQHMLLLAVPGEIVRDWAKFNLVTAMNFVEQCDLQRFEVAYAS